MQANWRLVLRHGALPLMSALGIGGAVGVAILLRPDDIVHIVLLITLTAAGLGLLVASTFDLATNFRRAPFGITRSIMLALPITFFTASVAGLQGARLLGPLTIGLGAAIVVLADYVLWPRQAVE